MLHDKALNKFTCTIYFVLLYCCCSNRVRLAATNALLNSLEFTKANFDVDVSIWSLFDNRKEFLGCEGPKMGVCCWRWQLLLQQCCPWYFSTAKQCHL